MDNTPVWETGDWTGLPSLDGIRSADLVVVGLGGSGLAAILEARELGLSVIGLDAGQVAGGAAGRNGGFLLAGTTHFYHDARNTLGRKRARALHQLTEVELRRMTAETPEHIRITGSLRIAWSEDELTDCGAQLEAMTEDGFAAEWYVGPEGSGLLFPNDGVFQPVERCRTLARRCIAAGAELYENSAATSISGSEVRTKNGSVISCGSVIVAVDGGLAALLPELNGRVRTARLQMLSTMPSHDVRFARPVYARYGYEYWQQLPDLRIALGGFRDRHVQDEWTSDSTPSEPIQALLEIHLREVLHVTAPIERRWAASVGYTDDLMPVFDEVRDNVWAIGGYSGTGNVMGAACGRGAAKKAAGVQSEIYDLLHTPALI